MTDEIKENQIVDPAQSAFIENYRIMNQIIAEMKEVPVLPSERPKDVNPLIKVEFPEEGGMLTYMENHKYPYKGFPYFEFVDKIDIIKKILRSILSSFYHSIKKRNKLQLLMVILSLWIFKDLFRSVLYTFYRLVERFRIKSIRYCTAVREIYRAFSLEVEEETPQDREIREMMRDVVCMLLEFDNAYRFRLQDILVEVNKKNLKKNFRREILRVLKIMSEREKTQEIRDTWKLIKIAVKYYLLIDRRVERILKNVILEIDFDKIELSVEDKHYCEKRKDYIFGFMKQKQKEGSLQESYVSS